jgi:tRNA-2-methylthio-N6-dimethylallyladenosine synthase
MKYFLLSLGCQMNLSDTERVQTVLHQMGYTESKDENDAAILGIIACSVRQKGIDKIYSRIQKWNADKSKKNSVTFVSGCILPADRERFLKLFDFVFPMNELPKFPEMLKQYGIVTPVSLHHESEQIRQSPTPISEQVKKTEFPFLLKNAKINPSANMNRFWDVEPAYISDFEAFIPIQNGCDKFCTYCAVPYTRGREVSRSSEEILIELYHLVENGYKSITLLGQNVNSYGLDKKNEEISFNELLQKIGQYGDKSGNDFWVYFTSPHPRDMSDDVIETISKYRCLAKQIHLPIQSGDNVMLQRMNRNHTIADYRHIIQTIRYLIPQATIFTDIIVGFTGETEEEFENTRLAMSAFRYNMAYIAQYSVRPGAVSSKWADDITPSIKKKRYHILTDELMKHSLVYNQQLVGKTVRVLVRGYDRKGGFLNGHTEGKIIIRFASRNIKLIGSFVEVKITSASPLSIEGEIVS